MKPKMISVRVERFGNYTLHGIGHARTMFNQLSCQSLITRKTVTAVILVIALLSCGGTQANAQTDCPTASRYASLDCPNPARQQECHFWSAFLQAHCGEPRMEPRQGNMPDTGDSSQNSSNYTPDYNS